MFVSHMNQYAYLRITISFARSMSEDKCLDKTDECLGNHQTLSDNCLKKCLKGLMNLIDILYIYTFEGLQIKIH